MFIGNNLSIAEARDCLYQFRMKVVRITSKMKLGHSPTHIAWKPLCPLHLYPESFSRFHSQFGHNASSAERILLRFLAKRPLGTITHSVCKNRQKCRKHQTFDEENEEKKGKKAKKISKIWPLVLFCHEAAEKWTFFCICCSKIWKIRKKLLILHPDESCI